jgi:hypothetical protein
MSEKHRENPENFELKNNPENSAEQVNHSQEKELTTAEKEHGTEKHLSEAAAQAERHAKSTSETSVHTLEKSDHHPIFHGLREKEMAWSRSMTRTRKKLSITSRAFSKFTHNPAVDTTSDFVGKTIARPSSMLGGALFAFVGSSIVLWATKYHGYKYNYLVFLILFITGSLLGLLIEAISKLFRKR